MTEPDAAPRYRIEVQGRIDAGWSEWLDRMSIRYDRDAHGTPVTVLVGRVTDQSALRGLLAKIWNMNLSVIGLRRIEADGAGDHTTGGR
jgi:hypothetical protein